jgi:hypothetical protein
MGCRLDRKSVERFEGECLMPIYRATLTLMPAIYEAKNEIEAEQMLEDYKEALAEVKNEIEFFEYHLSFYEELDK